MCAFLVLLTCFRGMYIFLLHAFEFYGYLSCVQGDPTLLFSMRNRSPGAAADSLSLPIFHPSRNPTGYPSKYLKSPIPTCEPVHVLLGLVSDKAEKDSLGNAGMLRPGCGTRQSTHQLCVYQLP